MTLNNANPSGSEPGLTKFDLKCLERLIKSGNLVAAAKMYRFACHCTAKEAEEAVRDFPTTEDV